MTHCPACAGTRVHTAVASRATGRRISTCRDCGARYWSDHMAEERMDAIVIQKEWSADDYGDWVDIKREGAGPGAWREALGWIGDALGERGERRPLIYDIGAGDGEFLSVARDEFGYDVTGNEIVAGAVKLAVIPVYLLGAATAALALLAAWHMVRQIRPQDANSSFAAH